MHYSVKHNVEENMIIAEVKGEVGFSALQELGAEIMRVAKQENCQYILTDLREAYLEVTVSEIYFLPQNLAKIARMQEVKLFDVKRAFVAAKDQEILRFYEIVSHNQGQGTRLFYDIEEAKNWLREYIQNCMAV